MCDVIQGSIWAIDPESVRSDFWHAALLSPWHLGPMLPISWPIIAWHQTCRMTKVCAGRINTLRPRQNGCHFADDISKCIFLNENAWIPIKISLKFVPQGPINNIPALVQIMAWRRPGDKPLSGPMMVRLSTLICVTRPQWVKIQGLTPKWHM